jgi:serine/threonine protein kinase
MSDVAQDPQIGSQFGPYLLQRLLGRGGMGDVYEAQDTVNDRTIALKLLPAALSRDPEHRGRFQREARVASEIDNPHVVPIHDFGEIDGHLYVDMQLIDGTDLYTILRRHGPMSPVRAVTILRQIASALDAAHDNAVTHRDVKPPNILVTPDDFAYLIDFGTARFTSNEKLTDVGTAIGTYAYMAPERFQTADVDFRADIYALTCVLYECLTGSTPYRSESVEMLMAGHLMQPIPRPTNERPDLPKAFDDVIACGMAKRPEDRYQSAGALALAAEQAAGTRDDDPPAPEIQLTEYPAFRLPDSRPAPTSPGTPLPAFIRFTAPYPQPCLFHDDVRFSVFRPTSLESGCWTSLLACIHVGAPPHGADQHRHPRRMLKRCARGILGDQLATYAKVCADSPVGLPEDAEITFVLDLPGFEVYRPSRTFLWLKAFHVEEYHIRAGDQLQDLTVRGALLTHHGDDLIAETTLTIRVLSNLRTDPLKKEASYSGSSSGGTGSASQTAT